MTPIQFELIDEVLNALENSTSCKYTGQPVDQVMAQLAQKLIRALYLDPDYAAWKLSFKPTEDDTKTV